MRTPPEKWDSTSPRQSNWPGALGTRIACGSPGAVAKPSVFSTRMKAVILAAGKGTRMGDLTSDLPKPMLRGRDGKPILEEILLGLLKTKIREFFIVTGFRADVIENYFGDGSKWGVRIEYGRQSVQVGTGKAPELARTFVADSPLLLTYGDI